MDLPDNNEPRKTRKREIEPGDEGKPALPVIVFALLEKNTELRIHAIPQQVFWI